MKKILIGALALLSISVYSQDFSNTRFGVTGGLNYSRVRNAHNPSGPRYTFQAGALAEIPISKDEQFYLQPEVTYYGAGETGKDKNVKGREGYDAVYANSYISVPVYLKAFFSESKSEFFGLFGPRFNFLINQKVENSANPEYTIDGVGEVNGKASGFNVALSAGVGYSYKRQLEISAKYDFGLLNTYKGLMKEGGVDPAISKSKKEHVVSIGINYIFN